MTFRKTLAGLFILGFVAITGLAIASEFKFMANEPCCDDPTCCVDGKCTKGGACCDAKHGKSASLNHNNGDEYASAATCPDCANCTDAACKCPNCAHKNAKVSGDASTTNVVAVTDQGHKGLCPGCGKCSCTDCKCADCKCANCAGKNANAAKPACAKGATTAQATDKAEVPACCQHKAASCAGAAH